MELNIGKIKQIRQVKHKFILFSEKIHKALVNEGYHTVKVTNGTSAVQPRNATRRRLKGYIIEVERYKNPDENGNWIYKYDEQEITKLHWYSSDPNDPVTAAFYDQVPCMRPKDTTGLTGKARRAAENHNKGRHGWIEKSPDVKITDSDVEYPLTNDRVKEMYQGRDVKFYLRINVGYNKGSYRKTNFRLYKRLLSYDTKFLRLLRNVASV